MERRLFFSATLFAALFVAGCSETLEEAGAAPSSDTQASAVAPAEDDEDASGEGTAKKRSGKKCDRDRDECEHEGTCARGDACDEDEDPCDGGDEPGRPDKPQKPKKPGKPRCGDGPSKPPPPKPPPPKPLPPKPEPSVCVEMDLGAACSKDAALAVCATKGGNATAILIDPKGTCRVTCCAEPAPGEPCEEAPPLPPTK